jgi:hypothetical protein
MVAGKDGAFHPIGARAVDGAHVALKTLHFSTYVPVYPSTPVLCRSCSGLSAYDDCLGCKWGFHVTATAPGGGACTDGSPFGVHCEPDCDAAYQTSCEYGCGPGYHVTASGLSGRAGCEGLNAVTCSATYGDSYDTCEPACRGDYTPGGPVGASACMSGEQPTHCTSIQHPSPTCSGAPFDGGADAAVDAGHDAGAGCHAGTPVVSDAGLGGSCQTTGTYNGQTRTLSCASVSGGTSCTCTGPGGYSASGKSAVPCGDFTSLCCAAPG